ncbi:unnamed protein product [Rotaria sp. Silwood1]|nr:unnamed protein product [Rotaria sp. Silwood1]CAF3476112.1 unnamed protein product [Rotaria sp. Silwood1]CAF4569847.1 unnamed protein product [Rotaria sp. Silwood1]CAF4723247.1 unnamed protein product [Rotaria sp. Silwood1]
MSRISPIEFKINGSKRSKINHNLLSAFQFDPTTISDDVSQEFVSSIDSNTTKPSNVSKCTSERSIPVQPNTHHDIIKCKQIYRKTILPSDPMMSILNNNLKEINIEEAKTNTENETIHVDTIKQDLSNTLEDNIENADYNQVPIEDFGMAALRGMGYNENIGLGKSNKKQVDIFNPEIRPRGLGLGADREVLVKINKLKRNIKEAGINDNDDLYFEKGAFIFIEKGSYCNLYGTIVSINEDLNRMDVKLAMDDNINEIISISQCNVKLVTEKEFLKYSKYMLPQLKDFNWYIDMKLLPGANGQRIQQPSCVLSLDINDPTKSVGENEKSVQIELSKETLNLVLDNFTRIREQLNTLAKRE